MERIKKVNKRLRNYYKNNKTEFILIVLVLLIAAFMRLWRISEYMTFLGDEGRDVIIVRKFLTEGDFFLIGPGTSIGNMYLGPMYYYMMAPALLLFFFSPVGPAVQIAVLGVITTWFVWLVIREWFPPSASSGQARVHYSALAASLLYALAPTVIIYSRSSWNPNIMPFFSLLSIYSLWRVLNNKNIKWLLVLGFSFAAVMQSHYLGLLLIPVLGLMWLLALFVLENKRKFIMYSILSLVFFLLLMSPLVIFDARHGWRNFDAMKTFFTVRQTTVSIKPWTAIPSLWPLFQQITTRVVAGRNVVVGSWTAMGFVLASAWIFIKQRKNISTKELLNFGILIIWLLTALVGFGIYKQHIYDHYYGFLFPTFFILLGGIFHIVSTAHRIRGSWIVLTAFIFLLFYNLADNPLRYGPNRQFQRSVKIAERVALEAGDENFNFAVVAERNYESAYRYFFDKNSANVVDIDPQNLEESLADQLFVVCEMAEEECQPVNNAKAEIANFGWSEIEKQWNVSGVVIYKLVHSE